VTKETIFFARPSCSELGLSGYWIKKGLKLELENLHYQKGEKKRNREMKTKPEDHITPGAKLNGTRKWGRFSGHEC
jgi:hypothetical protein